MRKILLLNDTRARGHHGSAAVMNVIVAEFRRRGFDAIAAAQAGVAAQEVRRGDFSAIVVNGEGSMHGGQKSARTIAQAAETANGRGIPVFLVNTLYAETTPDIVGRMKYFTAIYCRESASARRLAAQGFAADVVPDLTFALNIDPDITWRPGNRIIVIDSTLAHTNRILHAFCVDHGAAFQTIRTTPPLLRMGSLDNYLRLARFSATRTIGALLPRSYRFNRYASAVDARDTFLRRLSFGTRCVVSGRFHGVCFCMKIGVPFLAIASNTPKIEGLLADAGLGDRMLSLDDLSLSEIEHRAAWSAAHEQRRAAFVADAGRRIDGMFDNIARAIG